MLFPQVHPNEITGVEDDLPSMLVCLGLVRGIGLLNLALDFLMELLELLDSLGCLYIRLCVHGPWGEIKRREWLNPINHFEGGHARGFARSLVIGKLGMS